MSHYNKLIEDFHPNTGDIILFNGSGIIDKTIQYFSKSNYCHIGIVLKDCSYIDPKLTGTYFIESSYDKTPDIEEHIVKFGVMLHNLDYVIQRSKKAGDNMYLRRLGNFKLTDHIKNLIKDVYLKYRDIPYNISPLDWLRAKEAVDDISVETFAKIDHTKAQETHYLWCSAFVGLFYVKIGVLIDTTPWDLLSPGSFSTSKQDLIFIQDYYLLPEESI